MRKLPFPSVPANTPPDMRTFLNSVRDYMEILTTGGQDGMRRAVTFNDLVALGLVTQAQAEARAKVRD